MKNLYTDILSDIIFPSFIHSCIPEINLKKLKKEIYGIKEIHESVNNSNCGGYQSPNFNSLELIDGYEIFKKFIEISNDFNNHIVKNILGTNNNTVILNFWVNISKSFDYNVLHTHPHTDLTSVYYVSLPKNSGNLCLIRNDGISYTDLPLENKFEIIPNEGRLYTFPPNIWHYVQPGQNDDDRISITVNSKLL